jgi:translation initiation factor 2 subunit 3
MEDRRNGDERKTEVGGIVLGPLNEEIMKNQATINIGTIGHVAHGKSTIVRAISGVKTVRFKSELERNITIRLGYANAKIYRCVGGRCRRPECYTATSSSARREMKRCAREGCEGRLVLERHVSFVDCPGHDILMSTMLTGAAIMDAAVLVVAANEKCPQPQTLEHLNAIEVVDLRKVIILQNKIDLLTREQALESHDQIKAFIKGSVARTAPIVPISAQIRCNLDAALDFIVNYISVPTREYEKPPRVLVIRSFDINKPGCKPCDYKGGIIGGCLTNGYVEVGNMLEIRPGITERRGGRVVCRPVCTKIVSLFAESNALRVAVPGGLVGIGTELDPHFCRGDKLVGQVLGKPGTLPNVYCGLTLKYRIFEKLFEGVKGGAQRLGVKEQLLVNVGSSSTRAQVLSVEEDVVKMVLARPVCAEIGERVSISRKIREHWRLLGAGEILTGTPVQVAY